jgi:hypothetical protein
MIDLFEPVRPAAASLGDHRKAAPDGPGVAGNLGGQIQLECKRVVETPNATHLLFAVLATGSQLLAG